MSIILTETTKSTEVKKAICPHCKRLIHSVGFVKGSKCEGITIICKFCNRVYSVKAE